MVDFSQFFNPSAWGSWAPSGLQAMVAPQAQPQIQQAPLPPAQPQPQPMTPQPGQSLPMTQAGQRPQQPQQPNYSGLFQLAANMVKPPAGAPPLQPMQMARPVGLGQGQGGMLGQGGFLGMLGGMLGGGR